VGVTPDDDDSPGIQSADADCDAVAGNSASGNSRQHVAADMYAPLSGADIKGVGGPLTLCFPAFPLLHSVTESAARQQYCGRNCLSIGSRL